VGGKGFKFRLASDKDMERLSGYKFNAVTPFFMSDQTLPIILDSEIANLDCGYFWMGGGRVPLKIGISVQEFSNHIGERLVVDLISSELDK
jgi:prolyl-tRNA editing enzyme YbaK/EbsC (Cys-tRNA(Pro) deacylase)